MKISGIMTVHPEYFGILYDTLISTLKNKNMVSGPIPSWQIDGETVEMVEIKSGGRLYFLGLKNHCRW